VTEDEPPVRGVAAGVPNMARMYDYALDGKDNYEVDREAVERLRAFAPENKDIPKANRRFLGRAVRFVAEQGIRQFVDLGAGLPSQGNVHEVARQVRSDADVVYVDYDPVVLTHARALLAGDDSATTVVRADIREPDAIFNDPEVGRLIDFSEPVAVLFVAILHSIADSDDPAGIVRAFAERMRPGSYLILSHLTREGHPPELVRRKEEIFARSMTPFFYRSRAEIVRFFEGFELVEPGLTPVTSWRSHDLDKRLHAAGLWWLGGVGHRPGD
jgi:S-adenosyl methyltransferase